MNFPTSLAIFVIFRCVISKRLHPFLQSIHTYEHKDDSTSILGRQVKIEMLAVLHVIQATQFFRGCDRRFPRELLIQENALPVRRQLTQGKIFSPFPYRCGKPPVLPDSAGEGCPPWPDGPHRSGRGADLPDVYVMEVPGRFVRCALQANSAGRLHDEKRAYIKKAADSSAAFFSC